MALNPDRFSLIALVTARHVNMAAVQKGPIVPLGNPRVIGVIMLIALPKFCGKSQVCRISRPLRRRWRSLQPWGHPWCAQGVRKAAAGLAASSPSESGAIRRMLESVRH